MNKLLWLMLSVLMALPIAASAEVYKWKDKDGNVRYSDTPPPSNVPQLPVNGKKVPAGPPASVALPPVLPAPTAKPAAPGAPDAKKTPAPSLEGDAIKRQEDAEADKKKADKKEAELKIKQQNCANAKTNYSSYKIGGRMTKTNEKGEREYIGDADIAAGLEQAQKDMDLYCTE